MKGAGWMAEKSSVYVLPWKDDNDQLQAMDFGYYFPWGPWMDLYKGVNANWKSEDPVMSAITSTGSSMMNLGFLGGPLPTMINAGMSNKDPFTGREVVKPGSLGHEKVADVMSWLWTMWTPSMLGSTGVFAKLSDRYDIHPISAVTGLPKNVNSLNAYGRPRSTTGQDLFRAPGVNVYSHDLTASHQGNLKGYSADAREIKMARSKMMKNRNIAAPEKVKRLREYNEKLHRVYARRAEYLKGGK